MSDRGMVIATRLDTVLRAAGLPIVGVSIGEPAMRTTWTVQPESLQKQAQPIIDAFDPDDPAHAIAEAQYQTAQALKQPVMQALLALIVGEKPASVEAAAAQVLTIVDRAP